jgi:hypothetical protein
MGELYRWGEVFIEFDNESRREFGEIEGCGDDKADEYELSFVFVSGGVLYKECVNGE